MMTLDEVATALPRPEGRSPLARETIRRIEEKALQKLKCLIASKPGVIDRRTGELRYCRDDFFD